MMEEPLIEVKDAYKVFGKKSSLSSRYTVKALDGVNMEFFPGKILGLVGESGSGKTTLGLSLAGIIDLTSGNIKIAGNPLKRLQRGRHGKDLWEKVQMIFQDPYESLNERLTVKNIIRTSVNSYLHDATADEKDDLVENTMELVGLNPPEQFLSATPRALSGGERQRVSIARAIVSNPSFIVADEPVSMLDVSIRASILEVLSNLRTAKSTSMLFISHDIAIASYISDTIAVMHMGQIVEKGPPRKILADPKHPYTKILLESVPKESSDFYEEDEKVDESKWQEEPKLVVGCSFAHKCPFVMDRCWKAKPELKEIEKDHSVWCYLYE